MEQSKVKVLSNSWQPHGLYSPWDSPGQSTAVGSHSLLQGIFPTQGSNLGLPHCRPILSQLNHTVQKWHQKLALRDEALAVSGWVWFEEEQRNTWYLEMDMGWRDSYTFSKDVQNQRWRWPSREILVKGGERERIPGAVPRLGKMMVGSSSGPFICAPAVGHNTEAESHPVSQWNGMQIFSWEVGWGRKFEKKERRE